MLVISFTEIFRYNIENRTCLEVNLFKSAMQYNIEDTSWNILDTGGRPPLILERSLNILERSSTYSNEYIIKILVRLYPYQLLAYIGMWFYLSNFFITKKHLAYRVLFLHKLWVFTSSICNTHALSLNVKINNNSNTKA